MKSSKVDLNVSKLLCESKWENPESEKNFKKLLKVKNKSSKIIPYSI